jgi:hypothetical protein
MKLYRLKKWWDRAKSLKALDSRLRARERKMHSRDPSMKMPYFLDGNDSNVHVVWHGRI